MEKKILTALFILVLFASITYSGSCSTQTPSSGTAYKYFNEPAIEHSYINSPGFPISCDPGYSWCYYFDNSNEINFTFEKSYPIIYVYNVSNLTSPEEILEESSLTNKITYTYSSATTSYSSFDINTTKTITYPNSNLSLILHSISYDTTINSEGKSNPLHVTFTGAENETITGDISIEWYCEDYKIVGSNSYAGDYNEIYTLTNARVSFPYKVNTSKGWLNLERDIAMLSPYNLNDMVYVKNSNNNTIAIYAVYNGTEYLLTADTFDNYDVFYTDTSLLHRIQCGEDGEINLSSAKRNVLIAYTAGNLILDADTACNQLAQTSSVPDINDTLDSTYDLLEDYMCGYVHIKVEDDNETLNISAEVSSNDTTYNVVVIYDNGTQTTYVYPGSFNETFNLSNIDYLSFICKSSNPVATLGDFLSVLYEYKKNYGMDLPQVVLPEVGWVIFFVGLIPALFMFGRTHLSMIMGIFLVLFFVIQFNLLPAYWYLIVLLVVYVLIKEERRII